MDHFTWEVGQRQTIRHQLCINDSSKRVITEMVFTPDVHHVATQPGSKELVESNLQLYAWLARILQLCQSKLS